MDVMEYKCPKCGGAITFDSNVQQMVCPYCDSTFDVETLKAYDDALNTPESETLQWDMPNGQWRDSETENMVLYSCDSCGGEIVGDKTLGATSCPYCGNPVVMPKQFSGGLRPDFIIPFKLDKAAAKTALSKHYKGKILLPKIFKSENHIDEIKGVYVPFWLFDCDVDADFKFDATKVRTWSDRKYRYVETSHYFVTRAGDIAFDSVPVDGSTKMPDDIMESIEPFDYKELVDFQTAYMAGYLADKYDVDANTSIQRANERIQKSVETSFAGSVQGFSSVTLQKSNIRMTQGGVHYALLPVWILNTKWKNKPYRFAMNGQTGKLIGDLPTSWGKYWAWFGGIFAGVTLILSLILSLLGTYQY
jgi:DNA-directed RNA polymerase subunit RPC12/RpoP